ncbi:hypothetical protein OJAV_G00096110 [Oryzias javanicus]|uniref:Uncharacterized protein n=1 Tax=Oryzias javanicus TaxID=123683 RepID=A0A3S2PAW5_ORYJA|nr:hypothetical protein OJAV_G00096110 [Oryzias javanicus]
MTTTQSKPVYQNVEADSSKSSELDSSEENTAQSLQPELTGSAMPNAVEEGDSLEAEEAEEAELEEAEAEEAELEEAEAEEAEGSTDIAQDIEVALNGSNPEAAGLQLLPDAEASPQPQFDVNDASSTSDVLIVTPTPLPLSKTSPFVIPIGATLAGTPVCFTVQVTTPESAPLRGDSY